MLSLSLYLSLVDIKRKKEWKKLSKFCGLLLGISASLSLIHCIRSFIHSYLQPVIHACTLRLSIHCNSIQFNIVAINVFFNFICILQLLLAVLVVLVFFFLNWPSACCMCSSFSCFLSFLNALHLLAFKHIAFKKTFATDWNCGSQICAETGVSCCVAT